ncbi:2-methoxy-6-polyprenyl-1,4-benzoquinol methylase, mitochondrial [Candidatus Lokiarchaeum ossiferum]
MFLFSYFDHSTFDVITMSRKLPPRIPEGGAIENTEDYDMNLYSDFIKKHRLSDYKKLVSRMLIQHVIPQNGKLLEIGPGPGWIGILVAQQRPDVQIIGLEASKDMIEVATQNTFEEHVDTQIRYVYGFVESMDDFTDDLFDIVFSNDSLHHWENPFNGFKEIQRVLKPSGELFIHDERRNLNFGEKFIVNVFGRLLAGKMAKYWKSSIDASYTPMELIEILKKIPLCNWSVHSEMLGLTIQT